MNHLLFGFVALCSLWTYCCASVITAGTLGVAVQVDANTDTIIQFASGVILEITTSVQTEVTVATYHKFTPLPAGISALDFGGWNGYNVTVVPDFINGTGYTTISSYFVTPQLTAASQQLNAASFACLLYDPVDADYSQLLDGEAANYINNTFELFLPSSKVFIFVSIIAGTPIPTFYGQIRGLVGDIRSSFSYRYELVLDLTPMQNTPLTVTFSPTIVGALSASQSNYIFLNTCFVIGLSADVSANLIFTYNSGIIDSFGVSENSLVFGFETTSSGAYTFMSGTQINTTILTMTQSFPSIQSSGIGIFGTKSMASSMVPSILLLITCSLLTKMFY